MQSYPDPTTLTGASYWSSSCKLALPKNALQLCNFFKRNLVFMFEPYTYINQAWNIYFFSTSFMRTAIKTINFWFHFWHLLVNQPFQLYISRQFHLQFPVSWESWGANDWNVSRLQTKSGGRIKVPISLGRRSYPLLPVTWHFLKQQVRARLFFFLSQKLQHFTRKFWVLEQKKRQKATCLPPGDTTGSENSNKISIRNGDVSGRDIFRGLGAKGYGSALWLDEMLTLICLEHIMESYWKHIRKTFDTFDSFGVGNGAFLWYFVYTRCMNTVQIWKFSPTSILVIFWEISLHPGKLAHGTWKYLQKEKEKHLPSPPIFGFKMFVCSLTNCNWKVTGTQNGKKKLPSIQFSRGELLNFGGAYLYIETTPHAGCQSPPGLLHF